MKASFSIDNQQDFYQKIQKYIGSKKQNYGREDSIKISSKIGQGRIDRYLFSSGLELQIQEYLTKEPVSLTAEINYANLGMSWVVSGHYQYYLADQEFDLKAQQNILSYCNKVQGCFELQPNRRVVFLVVYMTIGWSDRIYY
ncbi:MAG: hypothetical protein AAFQ80_11690 [Cyanobacteria bacterium J06621_8]